MTGAGFYLIFISFSPPLNHTHVLPSSEVWDSPDWALYYHILSLLVLGFISDPAFGFL
jgi:hypothetical protein